MKNLNLQELLNIKSDERNLFIFKEFGEAHSLCGGNREGILSDGDLEEMLTDSGISILFENYKTSILTCNGEAYIVDNVYGTEGCSVVERHMDFDTLRKVSDNYPTTRNIFIEDIGTATITIYPEAQEAINKGWESLYFSENETTFAMLEFGEYIFTIDTNGEVKIVPEDDSKDDIFTNKDSEDICKLLDEGKLEDYIIDNNNWFAVEIGKVIKRDGSSIEYETIDDEVFEACPETLEELEFRLVEYAKSLYNNHC